MREEFGRKSIAAGKAERARENTRQGKPPCRVDVGVVYVELNLPQNGASPCNSCPEKVDCHYEVALSDLNNWHQQPPCYGDHATLDLVNPSAVCRACPVRQDCGSIVYELERAGQRHALAGEAIESEVADTTSPAVSHVEQGHANPDAALSPHDSVGDAPTVDAIGSSAEAHGGEHAGTLSKVVIARGAPPVSELAATPSGGVVNSTSSSQSPYTFPLSDADIEAGYKAMATSDLMAELERLSYGRCPDSGQPRPYQDVRPGVCAISLELNLRGGCCPGSRPMRKVVRPTHLSDEEKLLSNDRQVIDLHWLWRNQRVKAGIHSQRLQAAQFPFDWAADFVSRRGSGAQKAKALALAETDQLLLAVIQTRAVAERRRAIQNAIEATWQAIANIASSPASRLSSEAVAQLQSIHIALRIARGSPALACEVLLAMTGEVVAPSAMSAKKSWFVNLLTRQ